MVVFREMFQKHVTTSSCFSIDFENLLQLYQLVLHVKIIHIYK